MDPMTMAMMGGSLVSGVASYFGNKKANKEQQNALLAAQNQLKASRTAAEGYAREGRDAAIGDYAPIISTGDSARDMYAAATGVGGADAQRAYYANFQDDPGFRAEVDAGLRTLDRSAAARSGMAGGNHLAALTRYGQTQQRDAYERRLGHVNNLRMSGDSARSARAGVQQGYGNSMMALETGFGDSMAGGELQGGQLRAQNALGLSNAINSTMGNALKAYGGRMGTPASTAASNPWAATVSR